MPPTKPRTTTESTTTRAHIAALILLSSDLVRTRTGASAASRAEAPPRRCCTSRDIFARPSNRSPPKPPPARRPSWPAARALLHQLPAARAPMMLSRPGAAQGDNFVSRKSDVCISRALALHPRGSSRRRPRSPRQETIRIASVVSSSRPALLPLPSPRPLQDAPRALYPSVEFSHRRLERVAVDVSLPQHRVPHPNGGVFAPRDHPRVIERHR